jgi:hypothetical protein
MLLETNEAEVKTVAEAVEAKVEEKAKADVVQINAEEKLALRETELEYLKSQIEIQRISKITEAKSKEYQTYVEGLFTKYGLSKTEYIFDGSGNSFKKL